MMISETIFDLPHYKEDFLKVRKLQGCADSTIKQNDKVLSMFETFIHQEYDGKILTKDIKTLDLIDYVSYLQKHLDYGSATVYQHVSVLKSFYKFLFHEMVLSKNIGDPIRYPKRTCSFPSPILTRDEVELLLKSAQEYSNYYYLLLALLYFTGGRISSTLNLKKEDVNLKDNIIQFPDRVNLKRPILIHQKLSPILESFLVGHPNAASPFLFPSSRNPNQPLSVSTARRNLKKIKEKAGIKQNVTSYLLRDTMVTHFLQEGGNLFYLARLLGIKDTREAQMNSSLLYHLRNASINNLS